MAGVYIFFAADIVENLIMLQCGGEELDYILVGDAHWLCDLAEKSVDKS